MAEIFCGDCAFTAAARWRSAMLRQAHARDLDTELGKCWQVEAAASAATQHGAARCAWQRAKGEDGKVRSIVIGKYR